MPADSAVYQSPPSHHHLLLPNRNLWLLLLPPKACISSTVWEFDSPQSANLHFSFFSRDFTYVIISLHLTGSPALLLLHYCFQRSRGKEQSSLLAHWQTCFRLVCSAASLFLPNLKNTFCYFVWGTAAVCPIAPSLPLRATWGRHDHALPFTDLAATAGPQPLLCLTQSPQSLGSCAIPWALSSFSFFPSLLLLLVCLSIPPFIPPLPSRPPPHSLNQLR